MGRISSSRIRQLLATGAVDRAQQLLGRPYTLRGIVIDGDRRGRQLGFPTANLRLPSDKVLPCDGVYSSIARWRDREGRQQHQPAVLNLGTRPTFGAGRSAEAHLLDWSGDLYGLNLQLDLYRFLRPEQKFSSIDALRHQLERDCDLARHLMSVT